MQWIFLSVMFKRIKAIKFFMKDKEVPKRKKLIIVLGILFLISPINLMTIPVFGIGIIDDIILWSFIIYYLRDELDKYWLGEKEPPPLVERELKGKDIIDEVDYEVEVCEPNTNKHSEDPCQPSDSEADIHKEEPKPKYEGEK